MKGLNSEKTNSVLMRDSCNVEPTPDVITWPANIENSLRVRKLMKGIRLGVEAEATLYIL